MRAKTWMILTAYLFSSSLLAAPEYAFQPENLEIKTNPSKILSEIIDKKEKPPDEKELEKLEANPNAKVIQDFTSAPEDPISIGLVLDSSGSMGALLEGNKSKMFFLKKLMKDFSRSQWKQSNDIGVRIYGGRVKNNCADTFSPYPFSKGTLGKLEKSLEEMAPVGMTPLHKSIQMTTDDIKSRPGPKKILIVTDGEDTCGGDPCETAEKVKKEKLDLTYYVVALGYQGSSDALKKLSCLGDVSVADNEQSFQDALSNIKGKMNQTENLIVKSPNPDVPVYLYRIEDGKRRLVRSFYARSKQYVEPGEYEAVVGLNPLYKFSQFTIPPRRRITLEVRGEGEVLIEYFNGLIKGELLTKDDKVAARLKSETPSIVTMGKYKLRLYRKPFYDLIIPDFYVYPNGKHKYEVSGVGVIKVDKSELTGVYVYDQDRNLIDQHITGTPIILKTGVYAVHINETCSFPKVEVRAKKEIVVLPCP